LINNIADAFQVCHSSYKKLKKMNNQQKDKHEAILLGMALIMQMHCNDTESKNDQTWADTLRMIREQHFEDLRLDKERQQKEISDNAPVQDTHSENKDTDSKIDSSDGDDDSDDEIEFVAADTEIVRGNIFEDDDESEKQNVIDKETRTVLKIGNSVNMKTNAVNDKNKPGEIVDEETTSSVNDNDRNKKEMDVNKSNAPTDTDRCRDNDNDPSDKKEAEIEENESSTKQKKKKRKKVYTK
jgi:hypothetical protein